MELIETSIFTNQIIRYLSDEEYLAFQIELVRRPDAGVIIPGSGGLRKIRWRYDGQGKRGGIRVIFYWFVNDHLILLLLAYPKNVQEDLTKDQLKILKKLMESELRDG